MHISRRHALLGLTAAISLGRVSLALASPETEKRFVVILLRGALDGLSAVPAYGDPAFADLRGKLALPPPGQPDGVLDLGGVFGLHPSLAALHGLYAANELAIIHATAGHYRSRSHFEAQDYLESGADQRLDSGWLNRVAQALPARPGADQALAVGLAPPLILRGPATVAEWAPEHFAAPDPDLYARLLRVNARDPVTGPAMAEGIARRGINLSVVGDTDPKASRQFATLAAAAGRLLAQPQGPRIAALEIGGWDTHAQQQNRLRKQLAELDGGLAALKQALGPAWRQTVVLAVTEFGRTARINGTDGTDHGTAGAAFVLGGAVRGGVVRADWPGLGQGRLFEHRDLAPTTDLRCVIKGILADHLGLPAGKAALVLPGSNGAQPMAGLVRA